jgi:hypothetical protein
MTVTQPPPSTPPPQKDNHSVALWAAVTAFFGSLLAIGIFDVFNAGQWAEYLGAFIVAFITAGSVYAKERLDEAKRERGDQV